MATLKKKTEATTSRTATRAQAERRVEASPASPAATSRGGREPSREAISHRAFEIWERGGRQLGRDLENWLQAEAELRGS